MSFSRALLLITVLSSGQALRAGTIEVTVKDSKGAHVSDAVVYAQPQGGKPARAKTETVIDQENKEFVPYVTAVQVGTAILFPNKDKIRHHVYSLSPAKKFELPLYAGIPAKPVIFDQEGFVTLGCNIHDWMVAYVAVLPTPYFQVSGPDGEARLQNLPNGKYTVETWHPSLAGKPEQSAQVVDLAGNSRTHLSFTLELKPDFRVRRGHGLSGGEYP